MVVEKVHRSKLDEGTPLGRMRGFVLSNDLGLEDIPIDGLFEKVNELSLVPFFGNLADEELQWYLLAWSLDCNWRLWRVGYFLG